MRFTAVEIDGSDEWHAPLARWSIPPVERNEMSVVTVALLTGFVLCALTIRVFAPRERRPRRVRVRTYRTGG